MVWFGQAAHQTRTPTHELGWSSIQPTQRFIQSGMIQQDVFHPTLDSGQIERLRAHQRVRIQRAHNGIEC